MCFSPMDTDGPIDWDAVEDQYDGVAIDLNYAYVFEESDDEEQGEPELEHVRVEDLRSNGSSQAGRADRGRNQAGRGMPGRGQAGRGVPGSIQGGRGMPCRGQAGRGDTSSSQGGQAMLGRGGGGRGHGRGGTGEVEPGSGQGRGEPVRGRGRGQGHGEPARGWGRGRTLGLVGRARDTISWQQMTVVSGRDCGRGRGRGRRSKESAHETSMQLAMLTMHAAHAIHQPQDHDTYLVGLFIPLAAEVAVGTHSSAQLQSARDVPGAVQLTMHLAGLSIPLKTMARTLSASPFCSR